jgi:hypothetical protein
MLTLLGWVMASLMISQLVDIAPHHGGDGMYIFIVLDGFC